MRKIISLAIILLTIATCCFANENPFEIEGGKFKLVPGKTNNNTCFFIEFKDGKYSIVNGPSGHYSFDGKILKMIHEHQNGEKVLFHGRVTVNDAKFIRVEEGRKRFDFYRCSEKNFCDTKKCRIASTQLR